MPLPIDRGYAVISTETDGTMTVQVAAAIEKAQPVGVFARYAGAKNVQIDPRISWIKTTTHQFSTSMIEVSSTEGLGVSLMAPTRWLTT